MHKLLFSTLAHSNSNGQLRMSRDSFSQFMAKVQHDNSFRKELLAADTEGTAVA